MAQLVEHNLAKVGVAGSSPVVRSSNVQVPFPDGTCFDKRRDGQVVRQGPAKPSPPVRIRFSPPYADMAQLVEHNLAKVGVAGSSPVVRSRIHSLAYAGLFLLSTSKSLGLKNRLRSSDIEGLIPPCIRRKPKGKFR